MTRQSTEDELRDHARLQVRAGLLSPDEQYDEVRAAVAAEMPHTDANILTRAWLAAAQQELDRLAPTWPEVTDFDRLQAAFAECATHGVPVLQGLADRGAAIGFLADADPAPRGVLWFTPSDVWHAVDAGVLAMDLWHGTGVPVTAGDHLLTAIASCLGRHGLAAQWLGGRMETEAHWQRRRQDPTR